MKASQDLTHLLREMWAQFDPLDDETVAEIRDQPGELSSAIDSAEACSA